MNVTDPKVAQMLQSYLSGGAGRRQWQLPQSVSGPSFSPMAAEAPEGGGLEGFGALADGLVTYMGKDDQPTPAQHGYGQTQMPAQMPDMALPPPAGGNPTEPPVTPLQAPPAVQQQGLLGSTPAPEQMPGMGLPPMEGPTTMTPGVWDVPEPQPDGSFNELRGGRRDRRQSALDPSVAARLAMLGIA